MKRNAKLTAVLTWWLLKIMSCTSPNSVNQQYPYCTVRERGKGREGGRGEGAAL